MNKKNRRRIRKEVKDFLMMFFIVASFPLCFMSVYMTLKGIAITTIVSMAAFAVFCVVINEIETHKEKRRSRI